MASAPAELIGALRAAPADSVETRLRELRARLELESAEDRTAAAEALAGLESTAPGRLAGRLVPRPGGAGDR